MIMMRIWGVFRWGEERGFFFMEGIFDEEEEGEKGEGGGRD